MKTRSLNQSAGTQSDEFERRSQLVSLVYEVLRDIKTPTEGATNMAMFSDLSRAFLDKATALTNLEAAAPMGASRLAETSGCGN